MIGMLLLTILSVADFNQDGFGRSPRSGSGDNGVEVADLSGCQHHCDRVLLRLQQNAEPIGGMRENRRRFRDGEELPALAEESRGSSGNDGTIRLLGGCVGQSFRRRVRLRVDTQLAS
jgi:hypothetical protein